MQDAFVVAVIGAGFSGVTTAVHLLRSRADRPIRVVMVNRSGAMARGVAYGTNSPAHLLNVPAGRMSAFPDDPDHFMRFAQVWDARVAPGSFVRRSVYGEYLEHVLRDAAVYGRPNELDRRVGEVTSVRPGPDGVVVTAARGGSVVADRVVLAVGHYPPAHPPTLSEAFVESAGYVRDPWLPGSFGRAPTDRPALLIGTGLTMADVALDLRARGFPGVVAVSRRGLLPRPHDPSVPPATPTHRPPDLDAAATAAEFLRAVRRHADSLAGDGGDWRQVVDSLRPLTPTLWRRLPTAERARFLRHLRPYWDAHRHRVAPATATAVERLREAGWLTVRAGRVVGARQGDDGVAVDIVPRGSGRVETVSVGVVVNCTGPATDVTGDPLLADLFAAGLARPDPLGLGLDVAEDGAVVSADGWPSRALYYVGPLLRARDGEGTAVPELRTHAARLAETLVRGLGAANG